MERGRETSSLGLGRRHALSFRAVFSGSLSLALESLGKWTHSEADSLEFLGKWTRSDADPRGLWLG